MENKLYELRQDVTSPVLNFKKGERKTASEWKELINISDHSFYTKEWFGEVENPIFNREDLIGAVYDIMIRIKRLSIEDIPGKGPMCLEHDPSKINPMLSFLVSGEENNRGMIKMLVNDYLTNKA